VPLIYCHKNIFMSDVRCYYRFDICALYGCYMMLLQLFLQLLLHLLYGWCMYLSLGLIHAFFLDFTLLLQVLLHLLLHVWLHLIYVPYPWTVTPFCYTCHRYDICLTLGTDMCLYYTFYVRLIPPSPWTITHLHPTSHTQHVMYIEWGSTSYLKEDRRGLN